MHSTSKAFRAIFPILPTHMIDNIRRWADANLACFSLLFDGSQMFILLGLVCLPRTTASFSRTLRTSLRRMDIPVPRGHFVKLVTRREVSAVCADGVHPRGNVASLDQAPRTEDAEESAQDVRVVHLR